MTRQLDCFLNHHSPKFVTRAGNVCAVSPRSIDLFKLTKDDLLAVATEFGLERNSKCRKHDIREDIIQGMLEPDEIQEACEKIRRFESERITALEREQKQRNIEMEILAAERLRLQAFSRGSGSSMERKSDINMTKQLQPF